MIWIVELSTAAGPAGLSERAIAWLPSSSGRRCLVEADSGEAERLRLGPGVSSLTLAVDDLYIDAATRTVWEVSGAGSAIRLVGYVPP